MSEIVEGAAGSVASGDAADAASEAPAEFEYDATQTANVSSAIMFKLPTRALAPLRKAFESAGHGLNMVQFLEVFVRNMDLDENEENLHQSVPDLVDFFKSVDINGDGKMEWSEFVAFVIESVVSSDPPVMEKFVNVNRHAVQAAGMRQTVKVSKMLPEFNRLFVGIGAQIVIYEADDRSDTWLSNGVRIDLIKRDSAGLASASATEALLPGQKKKEKEKETGPRSKVDNRMQNALSSLDFVYLQGREMLIVLRSDICLEFHKFMNRSKIHADFILQNGIWPLTQPYNKLALRETRLAPWRLFAIGENRKTIDSWQVSVNTSGAVELSDYQALEKHTDFLRDVLVVHNDLYDLLVTCGMDKKVHLWDLTTLRYKTTRSGAHAGLQCLAFDGRGLLYAGGFDFNIIAWDLDAEIDRPIFQLWGHSAVVTRIVAVGSVNRAFSLDASGRLRMWDTSKSNPNDKEARQIDEVGFTEDSFRCLDVLRNVPASFSSANRVIINVQGRRNHVYKLVDMSPAESAPLPAGVLFSLSLLTVITIHSKDVLFFSAVTGTEQNKLDRNALGLENSPGNDLQVGVLDDRERKLIIGDAAGCISVYNCLSGVRLKTLATQVPFACRFMLYTPEKLLVTIAGPGELYIFDELPNFPTADTTMRDTRAHEVDVVALAYSYELGLIATADCTGTLCIWSFEFVTLEAIIHECTGTDIGQISFIGKFPLLLVTDSYNNFSILAVGPAASEGSRFAKTIWRVDCDIFVNPLCRTSNAADLSILDLSASEFAERVEEDLRLQDQVVHVAGADGGEGEGGEEEDKEEQQAGGKHPLTKREVNEYLRNRRDCKSMTILVQKSARIQTQEAERASMNDPHTAGKDLESAEYRLDRLLGAANPFRPQKSKKDGEGDDEDDEEFLAAISGTKAYDPDEEGKEKAPQGATVKSRQSKKDPKSAGLPGSLSLNFPEEGVRVFAICGYDDGSITVTDLTPAMRSVGLGELQDHEFASNQPSYDPRRYANRKVNDFERNVWTAAEVAERERHVTGRLTCVINAHGAAVTSVSAVCDGQSLLTGGADQSVLLWSLDGRALGTLTRGREWDKLFRPRWATPVDMATRDQKRRSDAKLLVQYLGLRKMMKKKKKRRTGELERELVFGEAESAAGVAGEEGTTSVGDDTADQSLTASEATRSLPSADAKAMLLAAFQAVDASPVGKGADSSVSADKQHVHRHEHAYTTDQSVVSIMSGDGGMTGGAHTGHDGGFEGEPERTRVIGQLHGRVTYHMSTKDAAKALMAGKAAESAAALDNIGKTKKRTKRERTGGGFGLSWVAVESNDPAASSRPKVQKSVAAKYLDDLMSIASEATSADGMSKDQLAAESAKALGQAKPRKIKSKYDIELEQLDADDPNNWEIHSSNRQRALYGHLYRERDKKGYSKDPMALFESKLDALSPSGDFRAYLTQLHEEREQKRLQRLGLRVEPEGEGKGSVNIGLEASVSVRVVQLGDKNRADDTLQMLRSGLSSPETSQLVDVTMQQEASSPSRPQLAGLSVAATMSSRHSSPSLRPPSPTARAPPAPISSPPHLQLHRAHGGHENVGFPTLSGASPSQRPPSQPAQQQQQQQQQYLNDQYQIQHQHHHQHQHRLTPAQIAAMSERRAVLALSDQFEASLRAVDRIARAANKKVKQQKLHYRKICKSLSEKELAGTLGLGGSASPGDGLLPVIGSPNHGHHSPAHSQLQPVPSATHTAAPNQTHGHDHTIPLASPTAHSRGHQPSHTLQQILPQQVHPMTALLSSVLSLQLAAAPHPASAPILPNTRHTTAALLLDKQASIQGVMEVTRKQKAAEQAWVRKVKETLGGAGHDKGPGPGPGSSRKRQDQRAVGSPGSGSGPAASGKRRTKNSFSPRAGGGVGTAGSLSESSIASNDSIQSPLALARSRQQRLDKKIAERKSFGPYATNELLALLKAFQSLPQVFVGNAARKADAGGPASVTGGGIVVSGGEGQDGVGAAVIDGDDDDDEYDFGYDDEPMDSPWQTSEAQERERGGLKEELQETAAETAARLEREAREQEEAAVARAAAERQRQEEEDAREAAEAEQRYSETVLATSIKLLGLVSHPFMKLRTGMKSALEKYIQVRGEDGTLPHNVVCALEDLPVACCPLMKPDDRKQLLRLFVLNVPSQDVEEAAKRGVTVQQLVKLKAMFNFFDKDGSGGIDKEEILEVLVKLQENSGAGTSDGISDDLINDIMGSSGEELSFDDFARVFKSLVQNE